MTHSTGRPLRTVAASVLGIVLLARSTAASEMPVPLPVQASLFAKILGFDRNLKARAGKELKLGVLYQKRVRSSLEAKEEFVEAMCGGPARKIEGLAITCVPIEWTTAPDVDAAVALLGIRVLYVAPLRAVAIAEIVAISRDRKITTLTGVPAFAENGIALGLTLRAERPLILVDLAAAREEGADFNSQLLKLARVLVPDPPKLQRASYPGTAR